MKKLLVISLLAVLVFTFAVTAFASNRPYYDRECEIRFECFEYHCYYAKCCRLLVKEKGDLVWTDWECVPIS